jgi:hypothetical protein
MWRSVLRPCKIAVHVEGHYRMGVLIGRRALQVVHSLWPAHASKLTW